jgi:hypothetical protein
MKDKYNNDPEYKEKKQRVCRERYHKKKLEALEKLQTLESATPPN